MPSARRLIELGTAPPLASEEAEQFTTNNGNWRRLMEVGLTPAAAREVANQLAGTASAARLAAHGIPPDLAVEMAAQIAE